MRLRGKNSEREAFGMRRLGPMPLRTGTSEWWRLKDIARRKMRLSRRTHSCGARALSVGRLKSVVQGLLNGLSFQCVQLSRWASVIHDFQ